MIADTRTLEVPRIVRPVTDAQQTNNRLKLFRDGNTSYQLEELMCSPSCMTEESSLPLDANV